MTTPNFDNNSRKITESQVKYVSSLCITLNKPVPNTDIYTYDMASKLISALQAEVNKNREFYASQQQLDTIKQFIKCPFINKAFVEELAIVPERWTTRLEQLKDEYKYYEMILTKGYARKKITEVGSVERVSDTLFAQGIIKESDYEELIWYRANLATILDKYNLVEIDGFIYERKLVNKAFIENKQKQVAERIASANTQIKERVNNPYMYLPKDEVTRFISQYTPYFKQWSDNRLSDKQFKYITELHKRINGTDENIDGYKLLTKKQASALIAQFEREQSYTYAINSEVEKSYVSYSGEEYTQDKNVAWEYENNKAWSNMLFTFNQFIGYKPEVEVNDLEMIKELINLAELMGASKEEVTTNLLTSYNWSVDEIQELGMTESTPVAQHIDKQVAPVKEDLKKLIELGYISKEELLALF